MAYYSFLLLFTLEKIQKQVKESSGSDLENFNYSLGSSGIRLYRDKA
jgi:hypothetical protein